LASRNLGGMSKPLSEQPPLDPTRSLARDRDQAARDVLFQICYPKVIRAVQRSLTRRMQSVYDPAGFACDAFCCLVADFHRLEFASIVALISYLETKAQRRVMVTRDWLRIRGEE
jgi:hypothetical protein